jgi:hypothetical protein
MNLLKIVYNVIDEQTIKVFHAMKYRNSYYAKLRRNVRASAWIEAKNTNKGGLIK